MSDEPLVLDGQDLHDARRVAVVALVQATRRLHDEDGQGVGAAIARVERMSDILVRLGGPPWREPAVGDEKTLDERDAEILAEAAIAVSSEAEVLLDDLEAPDDADLLRTHLGIASGLLARLAEDDGWADS